MPEIRQK